ncbi:acyltransferase family protein [Pantoea sp. B65]|uniref:acyltransferase family protein n=1 Tax=Pantoea sp. B65 TaxID=2813359 RepID=UPI0039B540DA
MRESWVDYAKGIGIFLVVFGHVNRGLYSSGIYISEKIYKIIDSVIYSFHMPLFFFLAGLFFVQSIDRRGKKDFLISKVDTVMYPYVLWSLIQGGIEVLLSHYTNSKTEVGEVLSFLTQPRAQFWFLYALFMIFFVSSVIYQKKIFNKYLPLLLVVSLLINIYNDKLFGYFHFNYITKYIFFFILGVIFRKLSDRIIMYMNGVTFFIIFFIFVFSQIMFHGVHGKTYIVAGFENVEVATISIAFIVFLSVYISRLNFRVLRYLGELSMVIYLMHIIAGSGMRVFLNKILHINDWFVHVALGTFAGIIVPVIAIFLLKRWHTDFLFVRPHLHLKSKAS